jgi:hypothetical protein
MLKVVYVHAWFCLIRPATGLAAKPLDRPEAPAGAGCVSPSLPSPRPPTPTSGARWLVTSDTMCGTTPLFNFILQVRL